MNRMDQGPWRNDYEAASFQERDAFGPHDGRNDAPLYGGRGAPSYEDPSFRDDARYRWAYPEASGEGGEGFFEQAGHRLAELGHKIEGAVSQLVGRGPKGYKRSDERIREDVSEDLAAHPFLDASDIEVTVEGGEVTLHGLVSDRASKRLAEDLAENVRGVEEVHNRLGVRRPEATAGVF